MKRGTTEGGIVKTFRQGGCVVWCGRITINGKKTGEMHRTQCIKLLKEVHDQN